MSIVLPTDLLIFLTPSVPSTIGASVNTAFGSGNVVAVARVERPDDLARQLEVGRLVPPDRHERRLVDDDVGRLEDRVGQQPVVDVVGLELLLLLVGRRPLEPAHRGHRAQQPGQLGVLGPVALDEQRAVLGIEPEGQQRGRHLAGPGAEELRVVGARQRVVVDDAVDRLVLELEPDVVPDRAEVVAEVDDPRRLDPAEDPRPGRGRGDRRRRGGELGRHRPRV